ncbi:MAG: hypothetical protein ABJB74_10730 [Gemmatimonas sp.]
MTSPDKTDQHTWAYREHPPHGPKTPKQLPDNERASDDAWRWLLVEHMPFHALDDKERNRLVDQLALLENELYQYNAGKVNDAPLSLQIPLKRAAVTKSSDATMNDDVWLQIDTRVMATTGDGPRLVSKQARLMEQAFTVLRLDRYANAPINRGVMNLFRAWASTKAFDDLLTRSEAVFSKPFIQFYKYYLRGLRRIDEDPIPHPWDRFLPKAARKVFHLFAMPGAEKLHAEEKTRGLGIYLDSGIIEGLSDGEAQLSVSAKDETTKAKDELPPSAPA